MIWKTFVFEEEEMKDFIFVLFIKAHFSESQAGKLHKQNQNLCKFQENCTKNVYVH